MSPAQGKRWKRGVFKDLEREERKRAREREKALLQEIRLLREERDEGLVASRAGCALRRADLRDRCRGEQDDLRQEVRQLVAAAMNEIARTRGERASLRRIEGSAKARARAGRPTVTRAEQRSESDDAVRSNLEPELHALWERVKRSIRGSDRTSRTEAFLQYVHDNPKEALAAIEDKTDALIEEMSRAAARPGPSRAGSKAAQLRAKAASFRRDPEVSVDAYVRALRAAQPHYVFGVDRGPVYSRIWKKEGSSHSVVVFVDADGTIYKADSWKKRGRPISTLARSLGAALASRSSTPAVEAPYLRLVATAPEPDPAEIHRRLIRAQSEKMERETTRHRGERYASGRDVKDVARLVRQDIAKEVKMGRLPRAKYSVTIERYSMGKAVNVRISDVVIPGAVGLKLYDEERLRREINEPHANAYDLPIFSKPAQRLLQHVQAIVESYQDNVHHGHSDYHRTNFHSSVEFDGPWQNRIRDQQEARIRSRATPSRDPASRGASRQRHAKPKKSLQMHGPASKGPWIIRYLDGTNIERYYRATWNSRFKGTYGGSTPDIHYDVMNHAGHEHVWRPVRREDVPARALRQLRERMRIEA